MGARYVTWIDGAEATIELLTVEQRRIHARIEPLDGDPREVTFDHVGPSGEPPSYHLVLPSGESLNLRVAAQARGASTVTTGNTEVEVMALPERDVWLGGAVSTVDEGEVIVSMPGLVVKLLAGVGEVVTQGQPVILVEAMKMENEVKAGRDGVVTAIHVAEGESVEADLLLMEIGDA
jgi:biotin carboxyl carrier protein